MRFPAEFADLLSPAGRRILEGQTAWTGALRREGRRFLQSSTWIDRGAAARCLELLEDALPQALRTMQLPIPPEATWGMGENYAELLPKSCRVQTAALFSRRDAAWRICERIGLISFLRSETLRQFAQVLNGRPLRPRWGIQVLCYRPGDYAGPHNDHHPEEPQARDGYLDLHLTFCNSGVKRQLLVYERRGHLCEVADVRRVGGLTAYRLPFWHYTTPLEPKRGAAAARRWVLLGTFLDAPPGSAAP